MPRINNKNSDMKIILFNIRELEEFELYVNKAAESNLTESVITEIKIRSEDLPPLFEEIKKLYKNLDERSYDQIPSYDEVRDKYYAIRVKVESLQSNNINSLNKAKNINNQNNVQLPKINLPSFTGNTQDFRGFFETFQSLVGNNIALSDVEKFLYLKNSLKGNAQAIVQELRGEASSYELAIKLLKDRYDNRKVLIFSHLDSIFDRPKLHKDTCLREFSDLLVRFIRSIDNEKISDKEFKASIMAYVIKNKADIKTAEEYSKMYPKEIPSTDDTLKFINNRCNVLEGTSDTPKPGNNFNNKINNNVNRHNFKTTNVKTFFQANYTCDICNEQHYLYNCKAFLSWSPGTRAKRVNELKLCPVCLRHNKHTKCNSNFSCKNCNGKHNNLLCIKENVKEYNAKLDKVALKECIENSTQSSGESSSSSTCNFSFTSEILLSTAKLKVYNDYNNKSKIIRVLLDNGSQSNLISEGLCRELNLKLKPVNIHIEGIGGANNYKCTNTTSIRIKSLRDDYERDITCLVLPKVTNKLPKTSFDVKCLRIPADIIVADDSFNTTGGIDILLGASMFYDALLPKQIALGKNLPVLQETKFGYLVSGNLPINVKRDHALKINSCTLRELNDNLTKFWQLDNPVPVEKLALLSKEEQYCESNYYDTIARDSSGKFVVSIPFKDNVVNLGETYGLAKKQFLSLERKFCSNKALFQEYKRFMNEYEEMGHMSEIKIDNLTPPKGAIRTINNSVSYERVPPVFLPHHSVLKNSSLTTKLRVVFNASAKSTTGLTLNETQMVGPQVQDNLFNILIKFRTHEIALTGDIAKMYRMININKNHGWFQHIIWRNSANEDLKIYRLNTVTYGTSAASYLATKCLSHLADLFEERFPDSCRVIKNNFYMDDLLVSANSVEEITRLKNEITYILASAGFHIRKFLSNRPDVCAAGDPSDLSTIPLGDRAANKTLGLYWNSMNDVIFCDVRMDSKSRVTKREILSRISKVFDPLGILSPIIVSGKLLIQELWQHHFDWDDPVPNDIASKWAGIELQFLELHKISIPRCTVPSTSVNIELHGFSDSSSLAYGCCVYIRCELSNGQVAVNLLASKSRVNPLKPLTIPKLELTAAVLLAEFSDNILKTMTIRFENIGLWTDSTIALNWINSPANKYKTFVANRIARIQELTSANDWHHVSSTQNPADLISRSCKVGQIINDKLWFNGPEFLSKPKSEWPKSEIQISNFEKSETKQAETFNSIHVNTNQFECIFDRYSNLFQLQKVVAYLLRFKHNCQHKDNKFTQNLSKEELTKSLLKLIKLCQTKVFDKEIKCLKSNKTVESKSIRYLDPFLDSNEIIRVGGRLAYSDFSYDKKYPILLPKGHRLTWLIMDKYHKQLLHCGPQQLLANIRNQYWPISGRSATRTFVHNCVKCFKANPKLNQPIMSNLPPERLKVNSYPFISTGMDFMGPILIKNKRGRGSCLIKSYVCVFVCMVTKAVHLELVSALDTESFLNCLKRFIARRGIPSTIFSDNATNFKGAKNYLKSIFKDSEIANFLSLTEILWKNINPLAPNEGGLWESGVKSVKYHLNRILSNTHLVYEDLYTTLTMIESVLNSRPLSYLSDDPKNLEPLTAGHFLIGRSLQALPEPTCLEIAPNRLSTYQRAQQLMSHFWKRWSREVVPELQKRVKWFQRIPQLAKVDSVILVQDDNSPPSKWVLGRIIKQHCDSEGVIRAVDIKTSDGSVFKRSIRRICVLPQV